MLTPIAFLQVQVVHDQDPEAAVQPARRAWQDEPAPVEALSRAKKDEVGMGEVDV